MDQAGAGKARARVTAAGYTGRSVRARSGLSEAKTEVQGRARVYRAMAGSGTGSSVLQGATPAMVVGSGRTGRLWEQRWQNWELQGFAGRRRM